MTPAAAQAVRTRNTGFSAVRYDNGFYTSALTLDEAIIRTRERSSTLASAVVSVFDDGRWSMQGAVSGSRYSTPIPIPELVIPFAPDYYVPFFRALRGEFSVTGNGSAQQGLLPTLQIATQARAHFLGADRGVWAGGGFSRAFDGAFWQTTLAGDVGGWLRRAGTVVSASYQPQQLQNGDLLGDVVGTFDRTFRTITVSANLGARVGEARNAPVRWLALATTFPVNRRLLATLSVGKYPADLLQGLPGARFASLSVRLPARSPFVRRSDTLATAVVPDLPSDAVMLTIAGGGGASTQRVVRVRAPASERVELMGDFTGWEPVQLVRTPAGVWEATLSITPGQHRLNVRLDGGEWLVPTNVARVTDEFSGVVGLIVVR